jgi:putative transposase
MAHEAVINKKMRIAPACRTLSIRETCYRYIPKLSVDNEKIADLLLGLTQNQRNWGFGLCFLHLRNVQGYGWNHKRVYRIYHELSLNLRIKPNKRLNREVPLPLAVPEKENECWSMDFMHDQLADGRSCRLFNGITLLFIQPGNPQKNAYIERFNRTVRYDWLSHYIYADIEELQDRATSWLWTYNNERPNMGIGGITPIQKRRLTKSMNSTPELH